MMARKIIRIVVLSAGVLSLALGLMQGGYGDTLQKAVKLCMECVGIG